MSEASDKLARTRLAIVEHVHRKDRNRDAHEDRYDELAALGLPTDDTTEPDAPFGTGWLGTIKHAAADWWRHHPAHLAVELATPTLSNFARAKPLQFIGIAAATGAVLLLARPWKLISATGLMVAVLKSPQLSRLVMSAMSARHIRKDAAGRPPV